MFGPSEWRPPQDAVRNPLATPDGGSARRESAPGSSGCWAEITVHASCSPLLIDGESICKPVIVVNGWVVPGSHWGRNRVPMREGRYHVRVFTTSTLDDGPEVGSAMTNVSVAQASPAELYYRAPTMPPFSGAIGPVPQRTPGLALSCVIWGITAWALGWLPVVILVVAVQHLAAL
ncbi:hypothetical protein OHB12_07060 [Nocardia sp. NBC_01730]|uniref:hypothetical protein n=1 Tax=Nocardia sp. NBC_01730 TaxID=2975998 RepID=UPI002E0FC0C7|nr:hypothetical protein OHB12_07060 [Nocardia sp. NBC_01730]